MKTKSIVITLLFSSFLLTLSCGVVNTSATKNISVYGGVTQMPTVVDLDVKDTKVTGSISSKKGESLESLKNEAVSIAVKNANADALVEPMFNTEIKGKNQTVTVTGYPANYKNFRPATEQDVNLLKVGVYEKAAVYEPAKMAKPSAGKIALLTLGTIGLTILLAILII